MFKAFKGLKKKLGVGSTKLQAEPAAVAPLAGLAAPPATAASSPAVAAAAAAGSAPTPASVPPSGAPIASNAAVDAAVDYELVAGPLDLEEGAEEATAVAVAAGAVPGPSASGQQPPDDEGDDQLCYGTGPSGEAATTEEAAAAAFAALDMHHQDAAASVGGRGGEAGGEAACCSSDAGGSMHGSDVAADALAVAPAAAAEATAEGEPGPSGGGGSAAAVEAAAISEALATMMYLTTEGDAEGDDDCVSVVSELSDDDLPDDISELSRALEALEGEALHGSSPGTSTSGRGGGGSGGGSVLGDALAERLGIAPDAGGDPSAFAASMSKLYNNLGLRMMERRKHEEALGLLRKAEEFVDDEARWGGGQASKRQRMQAITYNNLGCLFKRRNMPQLALQYLQRALALEEGGGGPVQVQNSSSTHLNICAAYSALKRPKEALAHAERAIILLQRYLWAHHLNFQEGLASLAKQMAPHGSGSSSSSSSVAASGAAPGGGHSPRHLVASANVLCMAYHNAAVEHERLGNLRESLVSFTRAYLISSKCLGAKAGLTASLHRALKGFQQRQARHLPSGAASAARKGSQQASAHASVRGGVSSTAALLNVGGTGQSKRSVLPSRAASGSSKSAASAAASKAASSKAAGALAAAAASGKATLPLDKGRTTTSSTAATGHTVAGRVGSSGRLAGMARQQQP